MKYIKICCTLKYKITQIQTRINQFPTTKKKFIQKDILHLTII